MVVLQVDLDEGLPVVVALVHVHGAVEDIAAEVEHAEAAWAQLGPGRRRRRGRGRLEQQARASSAPGSCAGSGRDLRRSAARRPACRAGRRSSGAAGRRCCCRVWPRPRSITAWRCRQTLDTSSDAFGPAVRTRARPFAFLRQGGSRRPRAPPAHGPSIARTRSSKISSCSLAEQALVEIAGDRKVASGCARSASRLTLRSDMIRPGSSMRQGCQVNRPPAVTARRGAARAGNDRREPRGALRRRTLADCTQARPANERGFRKPVALAGRPCVGRPGRRAATLPHPQGRAQARADCLECRRSLFHPRMARSNSASAPRQGNPCPGEATSRRWPNSSAWSRSMEGGQLPLDQPCSTATSRGAELLAYCRGRLRGGRGPRSRCSRTGSSSPGRRLMKRARRGARRQARHAPS